jgi:hypothetical protein
MANICNGLKAHVDEYGTMPAGNHAAIIKTLLDANPRKIVFLEILPQKKPDNPGLSPANEYCDPWGTPYLIDVSNPAFPLAYSFGKDKTDNGGVQGSDDIPSWR